MRALATASAMAALVFAAASVPAHAEGFASYGAYGPTHEYYGYAGYAYGGPRPLYAEPRYEAEPASYNPEVPGRSGWRRGEYLPPSFRTDVVDNDTRLQMRLRRAPRGYAWFHDADDYILASASTGLIFQVIPGD
jgi:Ni/Co efflux regulator RcnB